jgi:hypothetical protein
MAGWNTIDNQFIDPLSPNVGESNLLIDTNLNTTTVTLTYHGNDSWYNDVDPNSITTGNAKLMNGLIKSMGSDGVSESFQFNHVPEGTYDLYVYIEIDADGALADATDNDNITTYYITSGTDFLTPTCLCRP